MYIPRRPGRATRRIADRPPASLPLQEPRLSRFRRPAQSLGPRGLAERRHRRNRTFGFQHLLPMCPNLITPPSRAGRHIALGARRLLVVVIGVLLLAVLWWVLPAGPEVTLATWTELLLVRVQHIPPWVYLISFVVLPAFGVPIFAYYLTIGVVIDGLGWTLLAAWTCMSANMAFSYLLGRGLHRPLNRLATRRGYRIPRLRAGDEWKVILMVRASPLPWMMQNYLLTLGGAHFHLYMLYGVPVQAVIGLGVILLGDAILSGNVRWALIGFFLVAAVWVTLRIMRGRGGTLLDPTPQSVPDARPADTVGDEGRASALDDRTRPSQLAKR